nr:hypothetical protein [Tanacetum cinerariifolium]
MWSDQEKRVQKIDRLARSLLIQGLSNDIYSLIDSNKTAKDLWDALARHMLGSEYGEQDRKIALLAKAFNRRKFYSKPKNNNLRTSSSSQSANKKQKFVKTELSRDDAPSKGMSLKTGDEAGVEKSTKRGSNDTKELVNVLTFMDAANILTIRVQAVSVPPVTEIPNVGVPTSSGLLPTTSPIFTTASVVTPYSRRKGKEKTVELDTPKKKKLQEQIVVQMAREMEEQLDREDQRMDKQIARDVEIARIHAEEELQMLIDGFDRSNEVIARHLHEYEQSAANLTIGEKIELINELIKYQDHHAKILKYQA